MTGQTYKINIDDSDYSSWEVFDSVDFRKCPDIIIDPIQLKLFSNDVFSFENNSDNHNNNNNTIQIIHSSIRCGSPMPGVLILADNRTYGSCNNNNKKNKSTKNNKMLYKCIPDDRRLPYFLVPYEIKNIGLSKVYKNKYITFTYHNWDNKHPYGIIHQTIGEIDVLDHYYEYQLYCKSLNASIQQFQKRTVNAIRNKTHDEIIQTIQNKYPSIEDRTNTSLWNIFSIDPTHCLDFDDAFSIQFVEDDIQQISIYISNVTVWMDVLNLWDSFSQRISTIYLPDKKRPMLPTILSDCLCSLQKDVPRVAFVLDLFVSDGVIIDSKLSNAIVKVSNNYVYEQPELLTSTDYIYLLNKTRLLSKTYKYMNHIRNSHDIVAYLMILMNSRCALKMLELKCGIFRSTVMKNNDVLPEHLPEDVSKFITIWKSATGIYTLLENSETNLHHDLLHIDAYIHITSPIRRIVDLLNIIIFQKQMGIIQLSDSAYQFYDNWLQQLDYINATMRSIRKVQCDSNLLDMCSNQNGIMDEVYNGYLFDKIKRNDGLYQYIIFLPKLKLTSRITMRNDFENYSMKQFKLYLFNDELHFKKKIRVHCIDI